MPQKVLSVAETVPIPLYVSLPHVWGPILQVPSLVHLNVFAAMQSQVAFQQPKDINETNFRKAGEKSDFVPPNQWH